MTLARFVDDLSGLIARRAGTESESITGVGGLGTAEEVELRVLLCAFPVFKLHPVEAFVSVYSYFSSEFKFQFQFGFDSGVDNKFKPGTNLEIARLQKFEYELLPPLTNISCSSSNFFPESDVYRHVLLCLFTHFGVTQC